MRRFIQVAFSLGLLLAHSLALSAQSTCIEIRAGIDIGSGTTKMVVARVDACTQTIEAILAPQPDTRLELSVEYKKNIVMTADGRKVFRPEVEEVGLAALAELKKIAVAHGAQKFSAVATSAFREVSENYAVELTTRIRKQFGIPVRVIEQSEEARLGFLATIVKLGVPRPDALVWDIGGGSMQISFWNEVTRKVAAYEGRFANNAMQKFVIERLQGKPAGSDTSPNPMLAVGEKSKPDNRVHAAIRKAEEVAFATTLAEQRAIFRKIPLVIGIGGVHFYSNCEITKQLPGCEITREKLQAEILAHADLTDEQLVATGRAGSIEYASKRITAGALTVGFMKALEFERVRSLKVDMADGILVDPDYWCQSRLHAVTN